MMTSKERRELDARKKVFSICREYGLTDIKSEVVTIAIQHLYKLLESPTAITILINAYEKTIKMRE